MHTTRRSFLKAAAALPLAPSLAAAATRERTDGFVDAHSHIWSPDVKKWPLAEGLTTADLKPPSFTDQELLDLCRPLSVTRVVLIQHNVYHRHDNRYIVDAIRKNPEVFSGVAVIDHTAGNVEQKMVALKDDGIRGFRILPRKAKPGQWLQHKGMRVMWRVAAANNLAMCPLINPEFIPSVGKMCESFGDTRVVIDHFARIGVDGKIRDSDLKNLCSLARHKNVFVKVSAYYALGRKTPPYADLLPMIKRVFDAFGPQRLMWGSDSPYQIGKGNTYEASIDLIAKGADFLSDTNRDWVMRRTAEGVFFWK